MRKNPNPLVAQRASKKRRDQEEREIALMQDQDSDPRRDCRQTGCYDQARLWPLIDDEEGGA